MRVRAVGVMLIGFLAVVGLAGCGDDDDNVLTKAGFLARGNAACQASEQRIKEAANSSFTRGEIPMPEKVEAFSKDTVIPELDKQVEELEKLEPPETDKAQVDDIVTSMKQAIDKIDDDPTIIVGDRNPMGEVSDRSRGYGLRACANAADRVTNVVTGKKSAFD